jgi:translation initiation factor IF-1
MVRSSTCVHVARIDRPVASSNAALVADLVVTAGAATEWRVGGSGVGEQSASGRRASCGDGDEEPLYGNSRQLRSERADRRQELMSKKDALEMDGTVIDTMRNSQFTVRLDNGHELLAYTGGKMRRFRIRILLGDRVRVEMSPYDLTRGRVSYRYR